MELKVCVLVILCLNFCLAVRNKKAENSLDDEERRLEHLRRADRGDPEDPPPRPPRRSNYRTSANNKRRKWTWNATNEEISGATYVRWGRTTCPDTDSELVYSGVVGGSHYTHSGGGSDLICLTREPQYQNYTKAQEKHGLIYGAEYEATKNYFSHRNAPVNAQNALQDHDVPCAVCQANYRVSQIMIPGRKECHGEGWTREYWGYLVTSHWGHKGRLQYVCVDEAPEGDPKGAANQNGALLYVVQAACGSLPCPPYNANWELTCVVCTK